MASNTLPPQLAASLALRSQEFDLISPERKQLYAPLLEHYASEGLRPPSPILVVCTHNSRRSHIGQLYLAAAAKWYGLAGLNTYSGGTEATAFHPNAVRALQAEGFPLAQQSTGANPVYHCQWLSEKPQDLFSKTFDRPPNPRQDFLAIMVCKEADEACPVVHGAVARAAIPFDDPKRRDGQPDEAAAYAACVASIGREFLWFIHQITQQKH